MRRNPMDQDSELYQSQQDGILDGEKAHSEIFNVFIEKDHGRRAIEGIPSCFGRVEFEA